MNTTCYINKIVNCAIKQSGKFEYIHIENALYKCNTITIFLLNENNAISSPAFFGQLFNNLQPAALLTSLIQYDEVSFQIW